MYTEMFVDELQAAINHAIVAHSKHPRTAQDAIRFWDQTTPYVIHPIWCAMTLLTETKLPEDIRCIGYQVLLWHDILEDTTAPLPPSASDTVKRLVEEMTFADFRDEIQHVWYRSDVTKLLKLYDKVSNLLDGTWMSDERWHTYVAYTLKLTDFVEGVYGELNIVKIARIICIPRA